MQKIGKYLESNLKSIRKFVKTIIISIFIVQVLVIFIQVIWRFILNNPFSWSEELARYLQVWMILLTSSVCIKKGSHLTVDYATHALPFKFNKILKLIIMMITMFFLCIFIIYGIHLIIVTKDQITPALQIPILAVYLAFPISGLLMLLESLIVFFKLAGAKNETDIKVLHGKSTELGR